jgi:hypothetical protein
LEKENIKGVFCWGMKIEDILKTKKTKKNKKKGTKGKDGENPDKIKRVFKTIGKQVIVTFFNRVLNVLSLLFLVISAAKLLINV